MSPSHEKLYHSTNVSFSEFYKYYTKHSSTTWIISKTFSSSQLCIGDGKILFKITILGNKFTTNFPVDILYTWNTLIYVLPPSTGWGCTQDIPPKTVSTRLTPYCHKNLKSHRYMYRWTCRCSIANIIYSLSCETHLKLSSVITNTLCMTKMLLLRGSSCQKIRHSLSVHIYLGKYTYTTVSKNVKPYFNL